VTKADIIDRIAMGTGLTKIETEAVVNGFIATVMRALEDGENIEIRGFGSFKVKHRAARTARNPRTNEKVEVAARYVPAFKAARDFREAVDAASKARRRRARRR
jgi:nucleoid DNA-binding protein